MTSAAWARQYGDALLAQLEREANEGWPDLPWPPVVPPSTADSQRIVERILMHLFDVMLGAERRLQAQNAAQATATWAHTGQPKRNAA